MFGRLQNLDDKVLDKILKIHNAALNTLMIGFTRAGNFGLVWWLICLPFLADKDRRITGYNFIFALCICHLLGQIIIKNVVKRDRPCHSLEDDDLIVARPRYYSFPSGHTAASFAFVGVAILRCRLPFIAPVLVLASAISFSRIYLRVHYLTDVLAGTVLGLLCGFGSVELFHAFNF